MFRFSTNLKYTEFIDYKNIYLLRKYITIQGKILPRQTTKLTSKQQRLLTKSVKQSRIIGLLPFTNKESI